MYMDISAVIRTRVLEGRSVAISLNYEQRVVAKEIMGGIQRAPGCIRFREEKDSGPDASFGHVNVQNQGPEGK
jgi:hypothetical protein